VTKMYALGDEWFLTEY